jgi:hypothetical protein
MRVYEEGEIGLYRAGITAAPLGAIASFIDLDGNVAYMIAAN